MNRLAAFGLTALLATGCIQQNEGPVAVRNALPTHEQIRINVPENQRMYAGLGELSESYVLTRNISRTLNGGAAWVLILVHAVVQYPPTTAAGNTYTWGPHSDALDPAEWRLTVTELEDGSYDWQLDGRSKLTAGSTFETIIAGMAVPGADPHRGTGSFYVDFDAAERVNPVDNEAAGRIDVAYDLENRDGTPSSVQMHIVAPAEGSATPGELVSADYSYFENMDGSGDLTFALNKDLDDEGSLAEDAVIRSRWIPTGAGRADMQVSGGDLNDLVVIASECWDTTFAQVYYEDNQEWKATEGDPAACAFADADLPGE